MNEFDQVQAYTEGWCISSVSGSSYFPDEWLNIERLDEDEHDTLKTDFHAVSFVFGRAADGSEYHRKAVEYMEVNNFNRVNALQKAEWTRAES